MSLRLDERFVALLAEQLNVDTSEARALFETYGVQIVIRTDTATISWDGGSVITEYDPSQLDSGEELESVLLSGAETLAVLIKHERGRAASFRSRR